MSFYPALAVCRFRNSTGTQLWPDYGESFGSFPSESKQKMFYALLLRHLYKKHGYIPGVNFFVIPFDWRTGVQGLEQVSSRARGGSCGGSGEVTRKQAQEQVPA